MTNHYDPSQPRRADGQWTDGGAAIKKAASDKGNDDDNNGVNSKTQALVNEMKGKKITDVLPEEIQLNEIKEAYVFGSSLGGQKYNDIDVILFLDENHKIFSSNTRDSRAGNYWSAFFLPDYAQKGKIHFTVAAKTDINMNLFKDRMLSHSKNKYGAEKINFAALFKAANN